MLLMSVIGVLRLLAFDSLPLSRPFGQSKLSFLVLEFIFHVSLQLFLVIMIKIGVFSCLAKL